MLSLSVPHPLFAPFFLDGVARRFIVVLRSRLEVSVDRQRVAKACCYTDLIVLPATCLLLLGTVTHEIARLRFIGAARQRSICDASDAQVTKRV
jgi:hypothetical protein